MSNDFILCMRTVLEQGFKLLTCFKLPGVNFSPAIMIFGILSFGLAIILIKGIISVSAEGINYTAHQTQVMGNRIRGRHSNSTKKNN